MQHRVYSKLFGPEAKNYTKYRTPYPSELFDLLIKHLPKNSRNILDLACGTGKSTEPLVNTNLKVIGIDHDSQMIDEAKEQAHLKNLNIDYMVSDIENIPFPDEYFDVITIGTAFHFFMNETAITEIKRVLKSKGLLFVYWTLTPGNIPEEDSISGNIFKKYNWIKVPNELRNLNNVSDFLKKSDLQNITIEIIPINYNTTVEERVGLQTTSGFYETLSKEDKKNFLDEVKEELIKKLGNRTYFMLKEEIQVCLGFKD